MKKGVGEITKEDIRLGYQVAVGFWHYQGNLNWNRFNVMLVAHSVIASVIGVVFASQHPLPDISLVSMMLLAAVGMILCIAWVLLTARGFDYHAYWGLWAVELEHQLSEALRIASEAGLLKTKEGAKFTDWRSEGGEELPPHRFGVWSRVSQRPIAYITIVLFAYVYNLVIAYGIKIQTDMLLWTVLTLVPLTLLVGVLSVVRVIRFLGKKR